jgi:hypothetical protein
VLGQAARTNPGLLQVPGFVLLAGGLPIRSGGAVETVRRVSAGRSA